MIGFPLWAGYSKLRGMLALPLRYCFSGRTRVMVVRMVQSTRICDDIDFSPDIRRR